MVRPRGREGHPGSLGVHSAGKSSTPPPKDHSWDCGCGADLGRGKFRGGSICRRVRGGETDGSKAWKNGQTGQGQRKCLRPRPLSGCVYPLERQRSDRGSHGVWGLSEGQMLQGGLVSTLGPRGRGLPTSQHPFPIDDRTHCDSAPQACSPLHGRSDHANTHPTPFQRMTSPRVLSVLSPDAPGS